MSRLTYREARARFAWWLVYSGRLERWLDPLVITVGLVLDRLLWLLFPLAVSARYLWSHYARGKRSYDLEILEAKREASLLRVLDAAKRYDPRAERYLQ